MITKYSVSFEYKLPDFQKVGDDIYPNWESFTFPKDDRDAFRCCKHESKPCLTICWGWLDCPMYYYTDAYRFFQPHLHACLSSTIVAYRFVDAYRFLLYLADFHQIRQSCKKAWESHPAILHLCRALLMKRDENSFRVLYKRKTASIRWSKAY